MSLWPTCRHSFPGPEIFPHSEVWQSLPSARDRVLPAGCTCGRWGPCEAVSRGCSCLKSSALAVLFSWWPMARQHHGDSPAPAWKPQFGPRGRPSFPCSSCVWWSHVCILGSITKSSDGLFLCRPARLALCGMQLRARSDSQAQEMLSVGGDRHVA